MSIIWNLYFDAYLKKQQTVESKSDNRATPSLFSRLKPIIVPCCTCIVCAVLLSNSDDEVSQALNYIKPSKHAKNILEKANEQAGI